MDLTLKNKDLNTLYSVLDNGRWSNRVKRVNHGY
ncbi:TPA: DUF1617 family protein [Streptococcus pyogenes]|nr:DUF1617 family protein [Streptococcus pyogenes]QAX72673.1 DUF1617 family protein [Streptococcus pyogenes]HER7678286.1 DUF1617 family protein [Streptococcus pyogenes]HER8022814.1 DUF1617 family protein [Streptococcus pyogenes]HER8253761.1 DUF1617 family protein [Streptococcus pyogenes]HER8301053.1 DUF1617 family protein [Streptococcus pyogenes]